MDTICKVFHVAIIVCNGQRRRCIPGLIGGLLPDGRHFVCITIGRAGRYIIMLSLLQPQSQQTAGRGRERESGQETIPWSMIFHPRIPRVVCLTINVVLVAVDGTPGNKWTNGKESPDWCWSQEQKGLTGKEWRRRRRRQEMMCQHE